MEHGWSARRRRWGNRLAARRSARAPAAGGFTSQPEPRTIGFFARGRQLTAGNFLLGGHIVETHQPWDIEPPSPGFEAELHGFGWLDHMAAAGDREARAAAQGWVSDWITRYGRGHGPGWVPDLTGRRVIRWINHALFLTAGREGAANAPFFAALGAQTAFLARRWQAASPGLARFEAVTGLLYAGLSLIGMERHVRRRPRHWPAPVPAISALTARYRAATPRNCWRSSRFWPGLHRPCRMPAGRPRPR